MKPARGVVVIEAELVGPVGLLAATGAAGAAALERAAGAELDAGMCCCSGCPF